MGRIKKKASEIALECLMNFKSDVSDEHAVDITVNMKTNPVKINKKEKRAGNTLIVYNKNELREYIPDGMKNINIAGEFYIICGYVKESKLYKDSIDVVIYNGADEMSFTVNKKDTFFDKAMDLEGYDKLVSVLMCNNWCADLKLGPIFGKTGWRFLKRDGSDFAATDFLISA